MARGSSISNGSVEATDTSNLRLVRRGGGESRVLDATWVNERLGGRYRVQHPLGEGAMGTVFVAEHTALQKQVALKVIHPQLAFRRSSVARFQREARLAARIDHPNVVSIMDYGMLDESTPFLAMQLIRGASLADLMASGQPLPWPTAASLAAQIADALVAARAHGVIHRDLKPSNILIEPTGRGREPLIKVLDFGVAKLDPSWSTSMSEIPSELTPCGVVVGTAGYMSPEQCVGSEVTHRSDLYSLGVLLWEALTGERLFPEVGLPELLKLQGTTPERLAPLADHGVPTAMEQLTRRLLAYAATDRPDSPEEVRDALRGALLDAGYRSGWFADEQGAPNAMPTTPSLDPVSSLIDDGPTVVSAAAARAPRGPRWLRGLLSWLPNGGRLPWSLPRLPLALPRLSPLRGRRQRLAALSLLTVVAVGLAVRIIMVSPTARQLLAGDPVDNLRDSLLTGETRGERVSAARALLKMKKRPNTELPPYLTLAAEMQLRRTCSAKRAKLRELLALDDPRATPLLERMAERPRAGCGPGGARDCLACMRGDLRVGLARR